ncbi:hypothetical protein Sjap_010195 [Stephania japonica]|uniref:Uncharacterized protein n=1 Tax=Stephania japonica TaxID=461633 RepID=A0AAP0JB63_9MAGN
MNFNPKIYEATAVLFALVLLFGVSCVLSHERGEAIFYYFSQQWPGTRCGGERGCCYPKTGKPAPGFLIHGLRPQNFMNEDLRNCEPKDQLIPSQISNMTSELKKRWPSLDCPSRGNMRYWKSEWTTYGTCGNYVLNQTQYFKTALLLKSEVDLLKVLIKAGIKPDGGLYDFNTAFEAIRIATGYMPGIFCVKDKAGNRLLDTIVGCTVEGTKYNDCPGMWGSDCGSTFKFPPPA